MQRSKILSAILSMTLALTSFSAVPVTVSAAETEITAAPSVVQASAVTTASTPATTYVTTMNTTTRLETSATTSVTTVKTNPVEEGKATLVIRAVNSITFEKLSGIKFRLAEYERNPEDTSRKGELVRVIAEWTSSDSEPMIIENLDTDDIVNKKKHYLYIECDKLPENANYLDEDYIDYRIGRTKDMVYIDIQISSGKALPKVEFPYDIDHDFKFKVIDAITEKEVKDVDIEVMTYDNHVENGKTVYDFNEGTYKWNTGDDPEHKFNYKKHYEEDTYQLIKFAVKLGKLPEGYKIDYINADGYRTTDYTLYEHRRDLRSNNDCSTEEIYIYPDEYIGVTTTTVAASATIPATTIVTETTSVETTEIDKDSLYSYVHFTDSSFGEFYPYVDVGRQREFDYKLENGAAFALFAPITENPLNVEKFICKSQSSGAKGTLTLGDKGIGAGEYPIRCLVYDDAGATTPFMIKEFTLTVGKPKYEKCQFCGKYVPSENIIHGPISQACRDCYNKAGGYIGGSTTGTTSTGTGTSTSTSTGTTTGTSTPIVYWMTISTTESTSTASTGTTAVSDTSESLEKYVSFGDYIFGDFRTSVDFCPRVDVGGKREFRYRLNEGAAYVVFSVETDPPKDALKTICRNTETDDGGILTLGDNGIGAGEYTVQCYVFDDLKSSKPFMMGEFTLTIGEWQHERCDFCGKLVPVEDIIQGPISKACKECYDKAGGYIGGSTVGTTNTGTSVTGSKTETTHTTAETKSVSGDANCDGELSMGDAVLIMQAIANPSKFGVKGTDEHHITEAGKKNADIAGNNDGITNLDALVIQKKLLKLD